MKKFKKSVSLMLVVVLLLSLAVPVMSGADATKGSITITNPVKDQTYTVYKMFNLESYSKDSYSYSVTDEWLTFVQQNTVKDVYLTLTYNQDNKKYYVAWKKDADVKEFAKLAIAWAKAQTGLTEVAKTGPSTGTLVFDNLDLGYYLIDSSLGSVCALTTTDNDVEIQEKNSETTVKKEVKQDNTEDYGETNHAKIGDTVYFKSVVTIGDGAENLVLHDSMDVGLTLNTSSIKVYVNGAEVAAGADTFTVVTSGLDENCDFEIEFSDKYTSGLEKGTAVLVEYYAVLNNKALVAGESKTTDLSADEIDYNINNTWVTYGDNVTSTTSTTKTYTYKFDLIKTDENKKIIGTAGFYLYGSETGDDIIKVVAVTEDADKGIYVYRVATEADQLSDANLGDKIKAGYAVIKGLDKKVYYLKETDAPDGYDKLSIRARVDLTNGNVTCDENSNFYKENGSKIGVSADGAGGVQVINNSGAKLPGTGGIGVTLFYVIGGLLVIAGGVLLITRRRMNAKENN